MRIVFDFDRAAERIRATINGEELDETTAWHLLWHLEAWDEQRLWPTGEGFPVTGEGRPLTCEELRSCQIIGVIGVMRPAHTWVEVGAALGLGREKLRRERKRIGLAISKEHQAQFIPPDIVIDAIERMRPDAQWEKVASALSVSTAFLRQFRARHDIEPPRDLDAEITDEDIKDVVSAHSPKPVWEEVADELGVSLQYLRRRRREMGWEIQRKKALQ